MDQAAAITQQHLVTNHPTRRLGLVEKDHGIRLPHFDRVKAHFGISLQPMVFNYATNFPASSGALYNDQWGLCAYAGHYHRLQVVVFRLTGVFLEGDALKELALRLYEEFGFDPTQSRPDPDNPGMLINPTDNGGDMIEIADYMIRTGLLLPNGQRDKFVAAFTIDPKSEVDMSFCGAHCLGLGFGLTVTNQVMPDNGDPPPKVWDAGGDPRGRHFVYSFARSLAGLWTVDSWGGLYDLTPAYRRESLDTVIGYVSADALKDGRTVMNVDEKGWLDFMAIHGAPVN